MKGTYCFAREKQPYLNLMMAAFGSHSFLTIICLAHFSEYMIKVLIYPDVIVLISKLYILVPS